MDDEQINKAIGWAVIIIILYHIVGVFIPLLTYMVMIIVVWRVISLFMKDRF